MRLPSDHDRLLIIGKTGSGKTQAALWHLAHAHARKTLPWLIVDYKGDAAIAKLPTREIGSAAEIGTDPELLVTHPGPDSDDETEALLLDLWQRGNCGIWIDEAYMIPNGAAARALATQGRSKNIPMIVCTQRPVFMNRFFLSEADYLQFFRVNDSRDVKTVRGFMPEQIERPLPRYHSWYYDNGADAIVALSPVPPLADILARFAPPIAPEPEPALTGRLDGPRLRML